MLFHLLVWQQRGTCSLFLTAYGEMSCIIRHWRDILVWGHWFAWLYVVGHCSLRVWEPCQHIMMIEWCPLHLSCSNALVASHMVCTTNVLAMLDDSRLQSCKSHKLRVWFHPRALCGDMSVPTLADKSKKTKIDIWIYIYTYVYIYTRCYACCGITNWSKFVFLVICWSKLITLTWTS